ncbi:conserved hypothetical protein [Gammaproteobacteria bacterium]
MIQWSRGQAHVPSSNRAIVTLLIGNSYLSDWMRVAQKSWERYASAYGYDLIVISEPLDDSLISKSRSPAWQKCLILSQPWSFLYDHIIWLDADIIIHPNAPDILQGVPIEKIGGVFDCDHLSEIDQRIRLERRAVPSHFRKPSSGVTLEMSLEDLRRFNNDVYRHTEGIETDVSSIINTGVLVLSPTYHRSLLERVYQYPERCRGQEQHPLSFEILSRGLFHRLNPRFNWLLFPILQIHFPSLSESAFQGVLSPFLNEILAHEYNNSFFYHFAMLYKLYQKVNTP